MKTRVHPCVIIHKMPTRFARSEVDRLRAACARREEAHTCSNSDGFGSPPLVNFLTRLPSPPSTCSSPPCSSLSSVLRLPANLPSACPSRSLPTRFSAAKHTRKEEATIGKEGGLKTLLCLCHILPTHEPRRRR